MNKNSDTFLSLEELGNVYPPYHHTYDFNSDFINDNHKFFSECKKDETDTIIDTGIEGWLMPEDALKLYELAYFCNDDMLELGTYKGLSTSINATAFNDSKNQNKITTIDTDQVSSGLAQKNIQPILGSDKVDFVVSDAAVYLDKLIDEGKKFGFSFIDHSHKYEDVYQACMRLEKLIKPGGFCLFHDYNNPDNKDPNNKDYGVHQAIRDGLSKNNFEFYGVFGCSGLFRRI